MALIMLGFKSYTMSGRTNKTCVKRRWFSASNWSMRSKATAGDRYALKSPEFAMRLRCSGGERRKRRAGSLTSNAASSQVQSSGSTPSHIYAARMCCSCSVVKIEASVLLLVLVDLRLRTANSTTSVCCFKFKKSRRQYSRIKLLAKDLGCPPITTAREFPLCDFALLRLSYSWRHSDGSKSWSRHLHSAILGMARAEEPHK